MAKAKPNEAAPKADDLRGGDGIAAPATGNADDAPSDGDDASAARIQSAIDRANTAVERAEAAYKRADESAARAEQFEQRLAAADAAFAELQTKVKTWLQSAEADQAIVKSMTSTLEEMKTTLSRLSISPSLEPQDRSALPPDKKSVQQTAGEILDQAKKPPASGSVPKPEPSEPSDPTKNSSPTEPLNDAPIIDRPEPAPAPRRRLRVV